jgi:haloalkane dehalogenase
MGFMRVIDELRANYRVVAPDFPGFGQSGADRDFKARLEDYSAFVHEFCQELALEDFYLYLFDSSACIGLHAAPGFSSKLAGLILADAVAFPLTGSAWPVRLILRYVVTSPPIRFMNRVFNALPWLVITVAPFKNPFTREERDILIRQFDTEEKRNRILDVFSQMGWNEEFMAGVAERAKSELNLVPTLLLFGQFDPVRFVGAVSRFRKMFDDCDVRIIPLEEHFPILASGKRVAREVDSWIKQNEARKVAFQK